jgi:hypothetical protein
MDEYEASMESSLTGEKPDVSLRSPQIPCRLEIESGPSR